MKNFQNEKIVLIDNEKKIQSAALNKGIKMAKGDIVVRVDAHALYDKDYVRDFLNKLDSLKKSKRAIIYCTQASESSSACYFIAKCLGKKGYIISAQIRVKMPNNCYFFIGKKPTEKEIKNILIKADKKITL